MDRLEKKKEDANGKNIVNGTGLKIIRKYLIQLFFGFKMSLSELTKRDMTNVTIVLSIYGIW